MIIRFRAKDGAYRVSGEPTDRFGDVLQQQLEGQLPKGVSNVKISNQPSQPGQPIESVLDRTIGDLGLKHGDLLFLTYDSLAVDDNDTTSSTNNSSKNATIGSKSGPTAEQIFKSVKQLPIDDLLDSKDGKIKRPKDPKMCRHGDKGMCDYCMPLEPFDPGYQQEKSIKHLSFHAYLRKLNADSNKSSLANGHGGTNGTSSTGVAGSSSSYMSPLSQPFFGVATKCPSGHPPWPQGICSKCQPSAITLQQQQFRMVDHVEFADSSIVNSFIESWRLTGTQRIGYLYGRYEPYEVVPLGVKAVVEAIYEPPQNDEIDGVSLTLPWAEEQLVDRVASGITRGKPGDDNGLQKIGIIYTDLLDAGKGDGSVICKRHVDSYFLSSLEITFAADMQNKTSNPCRWSDSGEFSSKFVTCVITGNSKREIDISSYQVSTNAEAMRKADLIEPSANPSVMRIKEPTKTRYVPEIFYKRINEYKLTVSENAKPAFPVEYLLVTLTHGFPDSPTPIFASSSFPIENRQHVGVVQDFRSISKHLNLKSSSSEATSLELLSDFHLLVYLVSLGILNPEEEKLLLNVAATRSIEDSYVLLQSPGWQTLLTIIRESI